LRRPTFARESDDPRSVAEDGVIRLQPEASAVFACVVLLPWHHRGEPGTAARTSAGVSRFFRSGRVPERVAMAILVPALQLARECYADFGIAARDCPGNILSVRPSFGF